MTMINEYEATYLQIDKEKTRAKLKEAGFVLTTPEYLMRRKTFDFSRIAPGQNKWGRVRQEADRITMTIKEVRGTGISDTFELEMEVGNFNAACDMFEQCNVPAKSFQENYREVWKRDEVTATIDTWPGLQPFLEVESDSTESVRKASEDLGHSLDTALFGSIDLVYEKEIGIPTQDIISLPEITFETPPKKK